MKLGNQDLIQLYEEFYTFNDRIDPLIDLDDRRPISEWDEFGLSRNDRFVTLGEYWPEHSHI